MDGFPKEVLCIKTLIDQLGQKIGAGTTYMAVEIEQHPIFKEVFGYQLAEYPPTPKYGRNWFTTKVFVDLNSNIDETELVNKNFKEKYAPMEAIS